MRFTLGCLEFVKMKTFQKFKSSMGENYQKKVESLAKTKDVQSIHKICESCCQLEFDHRPGVCTRSFTADKLEKYSAEQISEIVSGISQDVVNSIIENTKAELHASNLDAESSLGKNESLAVAFNNLADVLKQQRLTPSHVTKVKIPPVWVKESFLDFKSEVLAWEKSHPGDDYSKYCELLNELKRNKVRVGLSDYVSTVVIEKTRSDKTVSEILKVLADKYELSKKERFENLVDSIKNFKPSKSESGEKILCYIEKIEREFDSLELGKNLHYFLATLFLKELFENDVINEIEKRAVHDLVNNKDDNEILNEVKTQFKKYKIEGKRDFAAQKIESDNDENKTYFVSNKNRSRYDSWKGSRDFKDYKRTGSNNWRTQSGNRWRKSQSQSVPGSRNRSISWSRDKSSEFRSMKDFQNLVLKELKSLKEKQDQMAIIQNDMKTKVIDSKYIETDFIEEDWSRENVKIYFSSNFEEVDEIVVDCGAPKTLIGETYLQKYLKHHKLADDDIERIS